MSFFAELRRRNVFRVAIAYIVLAWIIMQVGDTLAPALHLPESVNSVLVFFLILGFPLAVFFAWQSQTTTTDGEELARNGKSIAVLPFQNMSSDAEQE